MNSILRLLGLGRGLKITASNQGRVGLEIVEAPEANRPVLRPFSNAGETDVSWDLNALGAGVVNIMGSEAERQGRLGLANGYCPLDASAYVPLIHIPPGVGGGGGGATNIDGGFANSVYDAGTPIDGGGAS